MMEGDGGSVPQDCMLSVKIPHVKCLMLANSNSKQGTHKSSGMLDHTNLWCC